MSITNLTRRRAPIKIKFEVVVIALKLAAAVMLMIAALAHVGVK